MRAQLNQISTTEYMFKSAQGHVFHFLVSFEPLLVKWKEISANGTNFQMQGRMVKDIPNFLKKTVFACNKKVVTCV